MVLQPFLFTNCPFISHSTADICLKPDVDIKITGPKMEEIFLNRKGTIVCQVQTQRPYIEKIFWEDHLGNEMAAASISLSRGSKGPFMVPLDISYDEWSSGIKRQCVVEHTDALDQIKKPYERIIGKKTIQQLGRKSLFNSSCRAIKHIMSVISKCILQQRFPLVLSLLLSVAGGLIILSCLQEARLSVLQCLCCPQ